MGTDRVLRKRKGKADVKVTTVESLDHPKRQRTPNPKSAVDLNTETDSCVAMETIAFDVDGAKSIKQAEINLLSHCVFCLEKMQPSVDAPDMDKQPTEESLQTVPSAQLKNSSSGLLYSLNRTWFYLGNKNRQECGTGQDQDPLIESLIMEPKSSFSDKTVSRFLDVPEMCKFCSEKMETVHKLFTQLEAQLNALGKIVEESSSSGGEYLGRAVQLEKTLKSSNLRKEMVNATLQFLYTLDPNQGPHTKESSESFDSDANCKDEYTSDVDSDYVIKSEPESATSSDEEQLTADSKVGSTENNPGLNGTKMPKVKKVRNQENVKVSSNKESETKKDELVSDKPNCDVCGKTFGNLYRLQRHKRTVKCGKKRPFNLNLTEQICDLCYIPVPLADIYEHARAHVGEEYLLKCHNPKCPHVYTNATSLRNHFQKNNIRTKTCKKFVPNLTEYLESFNICQVCGHKATNLRGLRGHLLRLHEKAAEKNFACPIETCPHKFTVRQTVACHIFQHDIPTSTQNCSECSATLKFSEMEEHLKECHGAVEVLKCNHCPFLFSTRIFMLDHLYEHKRQGLLFCDICGDALKFQKYSSLREHYFIQHGIGRKYPCVDCGHIEWTQHLAEEHVKAKHGVHAVHVAKRTYKCNMCDAAFSNGDFLKRHKVRTHGEEPFRCQLCSASFSESALLRKHEREHGGCQVPEFSCTFEGCGKVFKQKKYLRQHFSSAHLGQKHICELCGKSYSNANGLRAHMNTFHLGIRKFICETCGESFSSGSLLRRHDLIHTGARPLACEICGQRFRTREVLKTHLESHRKKGADFKPNGPMKHIRKRVARKKASSP